MILVARRFEKQIICQLIGQTLKVLPSQPQNICVLTDNAWHKLNTYCNQKDLGNYAHGCIICLKFFSAVHASPVKKVNDCIVFSICYSLFSSHNFDIFINSLICAYLSTFLHVLKFNGKTFEVKFNMIWFVHIYYCLMGLFFL